MINDPGEFWVTSIRTLLCLPFCVWFFFFFDFLRLQGWWGNKKEDRFEMKEGEDRACLSTGGRV
jgi:hypothetical protein